MLLLFAWKRNYSRRVARVRRSMRSSAIGGAGLRCTSDSAGARLTRNSARAGAALPLLPRTGARYAQPRAPGRDRAKRDSALTFRLSDSLRLGSDRTRARGCARLPHPSSSVRGRRLVAATTGVSAAARVDEDQRHGDRHDGERQDQQYTTVVNEVVHRYLLTNRSPRTSSTHTSTLVVRPRRALGMRRRRCKVRRS